MAHAKTDGPYFPNWQRELFKTILDQQKSSLRSRRPTANGVQPAA
jgi:hypothetical protein